MHSSLYCSWIWYSLCTGTCTYIPASLRHSEAGQLVWIIPVSVHHAGQVSIYKGGFVPVSLAHIHTLLLPQTAPETVSMGTRS